MMSSAIYNIVALQILSAESAYEGWEYYFEFSNGVSILVENNSIDFNSEPLPFGDYKEIYSFSLTVPLLENDLDLGLFFQNFKKEHHIDHKTYVSITIKDQMKNMYVINNHLKFIKPIDLHLLEIYRKIHNYLNINKTNI